MGYQVLARKWRPGKFAELVGQEHVVKAISSALDNNRLHHAYLFTGTRGVGKTTIARIFSRSLNCETGLSSNPCGKCASCVDIEKGNYVDLLEIDAASRTKVEDTREILDNVQYRPTRGEYKVYLIDEVHMLSKHSFNALLKTLEEPPPHVKFLLATTDPQKLPVTILSRCLQFNLKALTREQISGQLEYILAQEHIPFEKSALFQLAKSAQGSMRDALSLTDQAIAQGDGVVAPKVVADMLGLIDSDKIARIIDALLAQDKVGIMHISDELSLLGADYKTALGDLMSLFHQIALTQFVPEACKLETNQARKIFDWAKTLPPEHVQLLYQITLQGKKELEWAQDAKAGFEMTLIRMLAFSPKLEITPATEYKSMVSREQASQGVLSSGSKESEKKTLDSESTPSNIAIEKVLKNTTPDDAAQVGETVSPAATPAIEASQLSGTYTKKTDNPSFEHEEASNEPAIQAKLHEEVHNIYEQADQLTGKSELLAQTNGLELRSQPVSVSDNLSASTDTSATNDIPAIGDTSEVSYSVTDEHQYSTSELVYSEASYSEASYTEPQYAETPYSEAPHSEAPHSEAPHSEAPHSEPEANMAMQQAPQVESGSYSSNTNELLALHAQLAAPSDSKDMPVQSAAKSDQHKDELAHKQAVASERVFQRQPEGEGLVSVALDGDFDHAQGTLESANVSRVETSAQAPDETPSLPGSGRVVGQAMDSNTPTNDTTSPNATEPPSSVYQDDIYNAGAPTTMSAPTDLMNEPQNIDTEWDSDIEPNFSAEGFLQHQRGGVSDVELAANATGIADELQANQGTQDSPVTTDAQYSTDIESQAAGFQQSATPVSDSFDAYALPEWISFEQANAVSVDFDIPFKINGKKVLHASQLDTWSQLIEQSGIGALTKQLVLHSNYVKKGDVVELVVAEQQKHLLNAATVHTIENALSDTLQQKITLQITVGEVIDTPWAVQRAIKLMRQEHAEQTIQQDAVVAQICQHFSGTVLNETIKPR